MCIIKSIMRSEYVILVHFINNNLSLQFEGGRPINNASTIEINDMFDLGAGMNLWESKEFIKLKSNCDQVQKSQLKIESKTNKMIETWANYYCD